MYLSATLCRVRNSLPLNRFVPSYRVVASIHMLYSILGLLMLIVLLAGCGQALAPTVSSGAVSREETVTLPTQAPTLAPSPVNTRVMPHETVTPFPTAAITPTITPIPDEVRGLVVEVIDGNTITVVMEGDPPSRTYEVRYLGIEAPPNAPDTPWGTVAYDENRKMTNLKVVRLVRDQTDSDDENHLLRYVYVGDEFLSIILVEQGLARANIVEPDTRFQAEIEEAEARARNARLGLWGQPPTPTQPRNQSPAAGEEATAEPEITLAPTVARTATVAPVATKGGTPTATSATDNTGKTDVTATATGSSTPGTGTPSPPDSEKGTDSSQLQGPQ